MGITSLFSEGYSELLCLLSGEGLSDQFKAREAISEISDLILQSTVGWIPSHAISVHRDPFRALKNPPPETSVAGLQSELGGDFDL